MDSENKLMLVFFGTIGAVIMSVAGCSAVVDPQVAARKSESFIACVNATKDADDCRHALSFSK